MPPIKTVIYLDVLLLTNFALTLLFLLAAGLLAGVECRAGRLLLGGAAGAASSLALLAPEAPDAAALLYKVSTAALTVSAAYGWPGVRCFARLVGWFCAENLLLAGALLLPGAQTNNGCIYLPLSPGALLAGAGGVVLAVQGVLRFLAGAAGRYSPPGSPWRTQRGCPGLLRHRLFSAGAAFGPGGGAGAVRCRAGPPAARPEYLSGAALRRGRSPARPGAGGAPCSLHHRGRALYPAGRPGQPVLHRLPRRAGQGRALLCRLRRPPPAA
nr:sigma-E processing peptidase SpoIIGA [Faecalibacterium prausnitzii]